MIIEPGTAMSIRAAWFCSGLFKNLTTMN